MARPRHLYVGRSALLTSPLKGKNDGQLGLAAWQKLWGKEEEGGHETEWAHFAWDEVRRQGHDPHGVTQALTPVTAALTKQHGPAFKELGPQWDLVGPGEAYVRALEATGKVMAKEMLRPAPSADGPFALRRGDKNIAAYGRFEDASAAAGDGDVIEIRTDDPIGSPRFTGDKMRLLTVRAAPGYGPVIEGGLDFASKNQFLILEGLHFRKGPLGAGLGGHSIEIAQQNAIVRLANCSFASETDYIQYAGRVPRNGVNGPRFQTSDGKPGEIVNCLIPGIVSTTLPPDGKLVVRNSVIGTLRMHLSTPGARALELDRCVVWNPFGDLPALDIGTTDATKIKATLTVSAAHTFFEAGSRFIFLNQGVMLKGWAGVGNVYRVGHRPWSTQQDKLGAIGLNDWRRRWQSDADSIEADPVDYVPQQWRLLPSSPGYQQGPGGTDLGGDVSRVAR